MPYAPRFEPSGDGGPAAEARLGLVNDVKVGPDGAIYIGQSGGIRRIEPDGTIDTIITHPDAVRATLLPSGRPPDPLVVEEVSTAAAPSRSPSTGLAGSGWGTNGITWRSRPV